MYKMEKKKKKKKNDDDEKDGKIYKRGSESEREREGRNSIQ